VTEGVATAEAEAELAGFAGRLRRGRPELTLKLALSLDGRLALSDGRSQWISGETARLHGHALRARADLMLVGGGTLRADRPRLDVRLPGYRGPQPARAALTSGPVPEGWLRFDSLDALDRHAVETGVNRILCEGGGGLAASLLEADRVDRLVILRAPLLLGAGRGLDRLHTPSLEAAHGRWVPEDSRMLGPDRLELYRRAA
jgi:diaminohydroxyphosphoribosylaminopyrimidine deaminase/5-amino-6-(5-phosphoribosylamino)uracil reductase